MSNRDRLRASIEKLASKEIMAELVERVEIWNEDPSMHDDGETFDTVDAFIDLDDRAEEEPWRDLERWCRTILIDAGYYRPINEAELARVIVTSGKKYSFKLAGVKYDINGPLSTWLEKEQGDE